MHLFLFLKLVHSSCLHVLFLFLLLFVLTILYFVYYNPKFPYLLITLNKEDAHKGFLHIAVLNYK
ncbi:hypothetical protein BCE_2308 [Bacillus cereus ATCC 10987]|uniref:Uncharacterized protein n=1 Tax=Bacillus cereus (strain ATCC 10987 / NRS 248) TaxID=222523 RepID=Q738T5_BACC1|nr:hypothetical protein BCE_2308 [Bacillus cereus ATCC 10987]